MESEESLEVASVSSTPPQSRHAASAQHCRAFSPFTPYPPYPKHTQTHTRTHTLRATPILSWSLFISSVSALRMLPHVNGLVITLFRVQLTRGPAYTLTPGAHQGWLFTVGRHSKAELHRQPPLTAASPKVTYYAA